MTQAPTDTTQKINQSFFKWANPGLFFVYFRSFQTNITILHQIYVKKCPSSIRCQDLNPRPFERESLPITTRPGLPPWNQSIFNWIFSFIAIGWILPQHNDNIISTNFRFWEIAVTAWLGQKDNVSLDLTPPVRKRLKQKKVSNIRQMVALAKKFNLRVAE